MVILGLSVGKGYHRIDAIQIWGAKGYGIAADGSLTGVTGWGTNTLAYPLHIPVLIAAFRILFGDILPASKMVFAGCYLALMLVGYASLLSMGVKRWMSGLGIILIATTPFLFQHGTFAYANLPLAFYLCASVVVFLPVFTGSPTRWNLILSGVFFASAAWTRPEGLLLSVFGIGLLLFWLYLDKEIEFSWKQVLKLLTPLFIYFLLWQLVKVRAYPVPLSQSSLPVEALTQILSGNFHLSELAYILVFLSQQWLTLDIWGIWGYVSLIAIIFILWFYKLVSQAAWVLFSVGCLFIAMMVGMYYLTSYDLTHDLSWWVTSGLNRMILPGWYILWLGIVGAFSDIYKNFLGGD
jgi:hypothetical protein